MNPVNPASIAAMTSPHQRQQGGAVVEFALVLALMVGIASGITEFGRTFWYYDALSKATRNAARSMSVGAKATIATVSVPVARQMVVDAAVTAGIPNFTTDNVAVVCLDAALNAGTCTNGTAPGGVRVQVTNYTVLLGEYIPFVIGASRNFTTTLAPATTMPYML